MSLRWFSPATLLLVVVVACAPGGASGGSATACDGSQLPATLHVTVSGFVTCACFDGTFALTRTSEPDDDGNPVYSWVSMPITGCPGQTEDAYLKMSFAAAAYGFGITDQGSDPGSGTSDFSPVSDGTCSPLALAGGGSEEGSITDFCAGTEDENMAWSLTD